MLRKTKQLLKDFILKHGKGEQYDDTIHYYYFKFSDYKICGTKEAGYKIYNDSGVYFAYPGVTKVAVVLIVMAFIICEIFI